MIEYEGSVVLVTGASGGIGHGICRAFLEAGAAVVGQHRTTPIAIAATERFAPAEVDITDEAAPAQLVETTLSRFGRLDALINNAGVQDLALLADMTEIEWRAMIDTNLNATQRLTQAALPALVETGGSVVHIASIEATTPAPMHAHYAVSKAGMVMHAKAAALEFGAEGVRVNAVSPGLIHRDGIEEGWPEGVERWHAAAPLGRLGTPADVANACLFLCSPLASWITGIELVVDGGVSTNPHW